MSGTELVTNADAFGPLRIVLVAPPYFDIPPTGYGGVEVVVADLADALVKRGHDVTVLGAGEPRTSARLIPLWERTLADRLGEPYPEIMHALKVRRVIERIATTDGVDIVHDHTFAGPLNTPAYSAVGIPTVVTVHGPIDDDLYPYYRELGDEVGLIAISDRQRELAPDLNWVGRVHNALRIDEWPFRADKGDYALFLGRYARRRQVRFDRVLLKGPAWAAASIDLLGTEPIGSMHPLVFSSDHCAVTCRLTRLPTAPQTHGRRLLWRLWRRPRFT